MRKEILQLKEKHQHVYESYNVAKADREAVCQQNDALRHEIQAIFKELQKEKALDKMNKAMKASKEAMSRQKWRPAAGTPVSLQRLWRH